MHDVCRFLIDFCYVWLVLLLRGCQFCLKCCSFTQANIDKIMVLAFAGTFLSSLVVGFLLAACLYSSLLLAKGAWLLFRHASHTHTQYNSEWPFQIGLGVWLHFQFFFFLQSWWSNPFIVLFHDSLVKVAVSGLLPFAPDAPGGPTTISLPEVQTLSEILRLKSEAVRFLHLCIQLMTENWTDETRGLPS